MGGAVSAGVDNEDLVKNLIEAGYITSSSVEAAHRAVDRGFYYTARHRSIAYRDTAWRRTHSAVHLSAPCVYAKVLSALQLRDGQSFLNIGSGTGYISTIVGLILGHRGINQGVELHAEVVDYANKKLDLFLRHSDALLRYDFCPPVFVCGNGLSLCESRQFDRVYCGASVSPEYQNYIQSFLKVDGILVMPINDQLVQVTRVAEDKFVSKNILPVTFATLVVPTKNNTSSGQEVRLPDLQPASLKQMCGRLIRSEIRKIVAQEIPIFVATVDGKKVSQNRKVVVRRIGDRVDHRISISDLTSDSSDDEARNPQSVRENICNRVVAATATSFSSVIRHVISHDADSSSSSSESDSGHGASAEAAPESPAASSDPSDQSSGLEIRTKRSCSTTEDDGDEEAGQNPGSPAPSSNRNRLAQVIIASVRERRRAKLQRLQAHPPTSSSSSSSPSSSVSTSSSPSSSSSSDRSLRTIDEADCSDDDENGQGIELLKARDDDAFVVKMEEKIRQLPLPPILQSFVNLSRPFALR